MTDSEQVRSKIQSLFQWLKNYSLQPRRELLEGSKLMYDVQVVEGIVKTLNEFSSPKDIHVICRTFYEAYLSGDKKSRFLVILLLPTMLNTYLVHLHGNESVTAAVASPTEVKQTSPTRFRRDSQPIFLLDGAPSTNSLESLAFLLSEFCQLAPAFIRFPEYYHSGITNLPNYQVASVYHSPPFSIATKLQPSKTTVIDNSPMAKSNACTTPTLSRASTVDTLSSPLFSNFDPACIVRIYVDALTRQFVKSTEEQQGIVHVSIRTFCDLVQSLTDLNTKRVLCSNHNHLALLIDLGITIDKILFMLSFELYHPANPGASSSPSNAAELLRNRLYGNLLPKLERYASYHCFVPVLLLVSAVQNAWRLRFNDSAFTSAAAMMSLYRRVRLSSDEAADLSDASPDEEKDGAFAITSGHRRSVFTNANFRAEPVAEDIPISGDQEGATDRRWKSHLYHNHNLTLGSQNHIRRHHFYHQQPQEYFGENLARSTEDLRSVLSSSSLSLNQEGRYHRRFWSRHRQEKS